MLINGVYGESRLDSRFPGNDKSFHKLDLY